jgi:hypothetical protein
MSAVQLGSKTMTDILVAPPEVPNKYDIIPIHASDIASFKRCRRYWDWSSPTRGNLRRQVRYFGINTNLWYGSLIHYALEKYYSPVLRRDPVESFKTMFKLQWEGGYCSEDELEYTYDINPLKMSTREGAFQHPTEYKIEGLRDLLPSPDEEEFMAFRDLGIGMMEFYKDYANREDDFEVVAAESQFSVPLGFEWTDHREESPNYGKQLEVHARGKRDAIVFFPDRRDTKRQYGIFDHKTASKVDEDYFESLENDPQFSTYIWASVSEAKLHDLPWKHIEDVVCNALRKVYPKPPSVTTRGFPSLNRSKESTTAEMFSDCVRDLGLVDWFHEDPQAQGYYEYLLTEGDKVFIQRDSARRNAAEIYATGEEIRMVAHDMLECERIYKTPSRLGYCTKCQFRAPCLAKDDGSDWKGMLADGYELNRDR